MEKRKNSSNNYVRLNKLIAESGFCSRRKADEYIESGMVKVNGKVITELGFKTLSDSEIQIGDKKLTKNAFVYVVLNKPKNCLCTLFDPEGRKTIKEFFNNKIKERIYPVGRLDRNTTGVILLTNDGVLTKLLTHPSSNIIKEYLVELDKNLINNDIKLLLSDIKLEDGPFHFDEIITFSSNKKLIHVIMHSGRNRIIRRSFNFLNYNVKSLERISFAGITTDKLKSGEWRYLSAEEVKYLYSRIKPKI